MRLTIQKARGIRSSSAVMLRGSVWTAGAATVATWLMESPGESSGERGDPFCLGKAVSSRNQVTDPASSWGRRDPRCSENPRRTAILELHGFASPDPPDIGSSPGDRNFKIPLDRAARV